MPRPGAGGGGHRSSSGHSSSRTSGGHRVSSSRSSSRPTGSRSSRMYHSGYHRPPRRYYGYSRPYHGRTSGTLSLILCFIVFSIIIVGLFGIVSSSKPTSTINREKLTNTVPYDNNCIIDELGYIENQSKLAKNLQYFYNETGIQPFIYLKQYDASLTSDSDKNNYALNWYDQNIDNECTFLFVYYGEANEDEIGYMSYVNGKQVTSIMDSEAIEIFWNYIDRYWTDGSLTTVEMFTKTFDSTANVIMDKSTTTKDIIKIGLIIGGVVLVVGGIVYIIKLKFQRDKEKAQETIDILNTPLDKSDELRDKYLNKGE